MRQKRWAMALGLTITILAVASTALFVAADGGTAQAEVAAEATEVPQVAGAWRAPTEPLRFTTRSGSGALPTPTRSQIAGGLLLAAGAAELVLARRRVGVPLDLAPSA